MIESLAGDSVPRVDSVQTTAIILLRYQPVLGAGAITGSIASDSIQVTFPGRQLTSQPTQSWPNDERALSIDQRTGHVTVEHQRTTTCTQETREFSRVGEELVLAVPNTVPNVDSWVDTVSRELCRGGVMLQVRQTNQYQLLKLVDTQPTATIYKIVRSTRSQLAGSGLQWQQPVEATGQATGIDTLTIDPATLRVTRITANSKLEIGFRSRFRDQRFLQTTRTEIDRRQ